VDAFRRIGAEEGMKGYFRGLGPSVARAAVQNASGIATYDHAKHLVRRMLGTNDGLGAQVAAAFTAGACGWDGKEGGRDGGREGGWEGGVRVSLCRSRYFTTLRCPVPVRAISLLPAGLVSASVSTPFDVIKTRIMNQPAGATLYKGASCAVCAGRLRAGALGVGTASLWLQR
jgi:hypothetical protein